MRWPLLARRPRGLASFAALSVASTGIVVAAVRSDGYEATATDLHDGTVWVLGDSYQRLARVNPRIQEFDAFVPYDVAEVELLQDTTNVYLRAPGALAQVNVYGAQVAGQFAELPASPQVAIGGGVGVIASGDAGNAWVFGAQALGAFKADLEPTVTIQPDEVVEVSPDGVVVALDPAGTYRVIDDGRSSPVVGDPLPFGHELEDGFSWTVVGDTPVALAGSDLLLPDGAQVDLAPHGTDFALQLPGPRAGRIVVASDSALLAVDLDGGEVAVLNELGEAGRPARPANVGGCVHGVWSTIATYYRLCGDRELETTIGDADPGIVWRLRTNRDQVAIEGTGANAWAVTDEGLVQITNWDDFDQDDDERDEEEEEEQEDDKQQAECQETAADPDASDDRFGAHPGVTVVLPVLSNDRDPNCDPMAVRLGGEWDNATDPRGRLELIDQGQAFQYTPSVEEQVVTFEYILDDGRGGEDRATVTVEVSDRDNDPPALLPNRVSETIVELGKAVSYNVLLDWIDPDGDQLVLEDAVLDAAEGSMRWARDGTITYTAADTAPGPKEIAVVVGDGYGHSVAGTLSISVNPQGTPLPPTARDDYVQAVAGQQVIVAPTLNDTDPNGDVLQITTPLAAEGVTAVQTERNRYRLSAAQPGTFLLPYEISDGELSATATIRFTVSAVDEANRPPVAVRDAAVTRAGRPINVDVLANDYDADNDVLALTDVRLSQVGLPGVTVRAIDRRLVRVEIEDDPGQPVTVEYEISDGVNPPTTGQLVVNVTANAKNQPPVAGTDEARVRVGDIVDIAVLGNDADPDNDTLTIVSAELDPPDQPGLLWFDGRTVRYRAGAEPRRIVARYTVDDSPELLGISTATGSIIITVVEDLPDENQPPDPPPLEARVFAGATVRIPVPTVGIDPDGDSVTLVGIGSSPPPRNLPAQLGTPTLGGDAIVYEAKPGVAGQDLFTYSVRDAYGEPGVGTVRVVVVDAPNHPPSPVGDIVRARPNRELQVPVLSNDTDPDGDQLSLVELGEVPAELEAVIDGTRVRVLLPETPGTWQIPYRVTDGKSAPVTQLLTVVAAADAPLLPPVARDDPDGVTTEPVITVGSDTTASTATVEVVENDDDPDGSRADLLVAVPPGQRVDALVSPTTGAITVTLTGRRQVVVYSVTDLDQNVAYATLTVPPDPRDVNRQPVLRDELPNLSVDEGQPILLEVDGFVVDPDGDEVQLAGNTPLSGDGTVVTEAGNLEAFTFTPTPGLNRTTATVVVPVTDRPGDPAATVELPFQISVTIPNQPPTVTPASVEVQQLGDPTVIDLVAGGFVTDPDGDDLQFTLTGASVANVDVDLSASGQLTFVGEAATVGDTGTVDFTVTDGQDGREPIAGSVAVRVISSTAPRAKVNDVTRQDIEQGQPETVDVLAGAFNPFPDRPLRVVEAELVDGAGTVSNDDGSVTFTPAPDFFGAAEVTFTVEDGTADPSRHVFGTIRYTVIGVPLQAGQPTVVEVFSETVVLQWQPADPQGTPITDYTVEWSGGSLTTGGATSATVTGLTNNVPVSFTVFATNRVGDGPRSQPSAPVTPDEVPPPPNPPRIVSFGDGTLTVEWDEVIPNGSPVSAYHLSISSGGTITLPASTLSYVWEGLTNGTDYTFTLVAENNEGRGDPSSASDPLSPAREPDAPAKPTLQDVGNNLQAAVRVTWPAPASNGREISSYTITIDQTGATFTSVTETIDIQVPDGSTYTFSVVAANVVGESASSPSSDPFPGVTEPAAPPTPTVSEGDRQLVVSNYQTGDTGGAAIQYYQYDLGGTGNWQTLPANGTIGGLSNGTTYQVRVRAFNGKFHSPPSGAAAGSPFGPPNAAAIVLNQSGPAQYQQSFTIGWDGRNAANGRPIVSARLIVSGLFDGGVALNGSQGFNGNWNTGYTVTLVVTDAAGQTAQRSITVNVGPPPPTPSVSIGVGGAASGAGCIPDDLGCYYVNVTLQDFPPGGQTVRCYGRTNSGWDNYASFSAGNGTTGGVCAYSYAGRVVRVVVNGTLCGGPNDPYLCGGGYLSNGVTWPTY